MEKITRMKAAVKCSPTFIPGVTLKSLELPQGWFWLCMLILFSFVLVYFIFYFIVLFYPNFILIF